MDILAMHAFNQSYSAKGESINSAMEIFLNAKVLKPPARALLIV